MKNVLLFTLLVLCLPLFSTGCHRPEHDKVIIIKPDREREAELLREKEQIERERSRKK